MNTANIVVTFCTAYSSALMHILWNFQQTLRWPSWKIAESFLKTKWPFHAGSNYIYYTTQVSRTIFGADKDTSIWAALCNDGNFTAVSPIPHAHTIWSWKRSSKRKGFSISDGYNVTNAHNKANLNAYLCTNVVYYCKWYTVSVLINPFCDSEAAK